MTQRGLTLLEVVIASALLALLMGASMSVASMMHKGANDTLITVDLERNARRFMGEVRRELRQSGWEGVTDQVSSPLDNGVGTSTLTFSIRTGFGAGQWSAPITYRLVEDGTYRNVTGTPTRYRIDRVQSGGTVGMVRNVAALQFVREPGNETVSIMLVLMLMDPATGEPKTVTHADEVALLNPKAS